MVGVLFIEAYLLTCRLVIAARREAELEEVLKEIKEAGSKDSIKVVCDVSKQADCK